MNSGLDTSISSAMRKFRTVAGKPFFGEIYAPIDYMPLDNFASPRRMMRTKQNTMVVPGDVFQTASGRHYMVSLHTDSDHTDFKYRTWRLFEVDRQVAWERYLTTVDPVTGLEKGAIKGLIDNPWAAFEHKNPEEDNLRVPKEQWRVALPVEVKKGDFLDGKKVEEVWTQLGIWFAMVG